MINSDGQILRGMRIKEDYMRMRMVDIVIYHL